LFIASVYDAIDGVGAGVPPFSFRHIIDSLILVVPNFRGGPGQPLR
jgi:hypothetical protein